MHDDIDRRLGWTRDLISDDPAIRERALLRYNVAETRYHEVLGHFHAAPDHRTVRARLDEAESQLMPYAANGLTEFASRTSSALLEYLVIYLRWEALYPNEWTWHAKRWGYKKAWLRRLAWHIHELPAHLLPQLAELVVLAAARPQRVRDQYYARLARRLPREPLYSRLVQLHESGDPTTRERAGYLIWLLDDPLQAAPKLSQWRRYLREHHGRTEHPHQAAQPDSNGWRAYLAGTVVVCPRPDCAAPALTSRQPSADPYDRRRLVCTGSCPPFEEPAPGYVYTRGEDPEVDADFGLPLWLQRRCRDGRTVWAFHARHLDTIERCVRARSGSGPVDDAWPGPYGRVPGWMSTDRYREEVLAVIADLRATLPAALRGPGPAATIEP
ncbi:hypothetical protein [Catellatospora tritici]|uniref:hypothetical protein n=1 Tax=Catellatospora tritici TaxID=2851566 RepID=UPI001C2D62F2|nr:hypothetical protein [Catellatospora tritici]MBV1850795.1 hypothetical protein [Catellatospora tritici]MBV1851048.1 hypothetical protein [Catellatospora tritici]